jgi:hypothetical protein
VRSDDRLRAIGEVTQAILDDIPLDEVFERLATRARALLQADSVLIGTLEGDGLLVRLRVVVGSQAARVPVARSGRWLKPCWPRPSAPAAPRLPSTGRRRLISPWRPSGWVVAT